MLHDSIYMECPEKENFRDGKQIRVGIGEGSDYT